MIAIVVAAGASRQGSDTGLEIGALVFRVAIYATDTGGLMWFDNRSNKGIALVALSTTLVHSPFPGMTRSTRAGIWLSGNRRNHDHLTFTVYLCERRRHKSFCVGTSRSHRKNTYKKERPNKSDPGQRDWRSLVANQLNWAFPGSSLTLWE